MQIFRKIPDIQNYLKIQKNKTIGYVPTMGALHEGHLSLVQESKKHCDLTVVSIFVNPTQFAPNEDLANYPRPIEADKKLLEKLDVDVLFLPEVEEVYPKHKNQVENVAPTLLNKNCHPEPVEGFPCGCVALRQAQCDTFFLPIFTKELEGASRPTHFTGVAQVVKRLFEIVKPTDAFFGQKDFQQTLVIKWLIEKYQFRINLHVCPIVREKDGLAMSSRNMYLNPEERKAALILRQTLDLAQILALNGEKDVGKIEATMRENIAKEKLAVLDYAVIRNRNDLSEQEIVDENSIALVVVKIGKTRLLDNAVFQNPLEGAGGC